MLQELKLKDGIMNEHVFNQLIRVYASACMVPQVKNEHIDMYVRDAWQLFEQMQEIPECEVNINILNSLVHLYS